MTTSQIVFGSLHGGVPADGPRNSTQKGHAQKKSSGSIKISTLGTFWSGWGWGGEGGGGGEEGKELLKGQRYVHPV